MWTEQRVEALKRYWGDGLSASQIAGEIGDVSRNAVIGKAHRLGLALSERSKDGVRVTRPRTRLSSKIVIRPGRKRSYGGEVAVVSVTEPEQPMVDDLAIPSEQRRTLLQLNAETCRWPVGHPNEPDFFFCGAKPAREMPYCAHHCRIAYNPAGSQSREVRAP